MEMAAGPRKRSPSRDSAQTVGKSRNTGAPCPLSETARHRPARQIYFRERNRPSEAPNFFLTLNSTIGSMAIRRFRPAATRYPNMRENLTLVVRRSTPKNFPFFITGSKARMPKFQRIQAAALIVSVDQQRLRPLFRSLHATTNGLPRSKRLATAPSSRNGLSANSHIRHVSLVSSVG